VIEWYQDPMLNTLLDTGASFQTGALSGDTNFYVRAALITTALDSFSFSTAGATGNTGPSQSQINSAYSGTNLDGIVTSQNGIQLWTAPVTGIYRIKAAGGQGFGPFGGRGAEMEGDFQITAGTQLKILVGQQAGPPIGSSNQYGGGGGSFVTRTDNTPLVIAGGGGGSWDPSSFHPNSDGKTTNSGSDGINGTTNATGGTNGNGGNSGNFADGGAGLTGNGNGSAGGQSFINGGNGGVDRGQGGFGGGGGTSSWDNRRSGGGGGYSGGGGSAASSSTTGNPVGGGGGSFNSGSNQTNNAGANTGNGYVTIAYNVPGVACYSNVIPVPVRIGQTPSSPNILAVTPIAVCQGDSVVIQSDAGPATIWSDGQTGGVATFTTQQQVTAQRTDTLGCLSAPSVSVPVTVNPTPVINSLLTQGICEGSPVQLIVQTSVSSINGASITQQIADLGDGSQINVTNTITNHNYASPGNYTIDLTVASNHGCQVQDSVNLTIYPAPQIQPLATSPLCLSDTFQLSPSFTIGAFGNTSVNSYAWNFGDGSSSNQQNASHIYSTAGVFPVSFTALSSQGCSAQVQTTVTVNPRPDLISLNAPAVCENATSQITLNANPGGSPLQTISWNLGDGNALSQQGFQLSHLYVQPGTYIVNVTATDANGCSESIQTSAVVNPVPQIQSITAPAVCSGALSSLSAQATIASVNNAGIQQYNWSLGDGNSAQGSFITHNYAQEGTFNVNLIVVSNQGCTDTLIQQVFVNPLPQVQGLSGLTACLNSQLSLNPPIQIAPINNAQIASGVWNMGDGTQLNGTSVNHSYLQVGTFPVNFTVSSNHGCITTVQSSATVHPRPQITAANAGSVCFGNTSQFIQTSTVPGIGPAPITSVFWDFGDGNQSGLATPSHTYNSAGVYPVSVVVTTDQGCTDSIQIQAIVNALPDISLNSPIQACENGLVNFAPSISVAPVNNASIFQAIWNFGDGNQAQGNNVNHTYLNAGTYNATVTASTQHGCTETASTTVIVSPTPVSSPLFDQYCIGETIPYNANASISSGTITSYTWNFGDGFGVSNQIQGIYSYVTPGMFTVTLTLVSDAGCTSQVSVPVFIESIPASNFSASLLQPFQVQFVPDFVGPMASHIWDFGDGDSSLQALPMHIYGGPGQFTVCLTASNGVCSTQTCQPIQLNTTGIIGEGDGSITSAVLYPNPFTHSSELSLELHESGTVHVYISDMAGRTLFSRKAHADAGEWRFILNQSELNLSTGVYLLNISANGLIHSLKLIKSAD
jgi:PKD repeat protein